MRKVLVVNDKADMGRSYYLPFSFIGPKTNNKNLIYSDPKTIALVVFTGGADVSPKLYNEREGKLTHSDYYRDEEETEIFKEAIKQNIPMFGICRGLQFLTVMNHGRLIQHVTGHHRSHQMKTSYGTEFEVTSSHHQMVVPQAEDHVIGWSTPRLSSTYLDGDDREQTPPRYEVEAVRFNKAPVLGVQYHPEIMEKEEPGFYYVEDIIRRFLPNVAN